MVYKIVISVIDNAEHPVRSCIFRIIPQVLECEMHISKARVYLWNRKIFLNSDTKSEIGLLLLTNG